VEQFADDFEAHGSCADNIQDVCIDMSASYHAGVQEHLPSATITFDEFHVVQLLTKAVDEVRRAEVKQLPELKRSRYLWLKDKRKWTRQQVLQHANLSRMNLKTHRATRITRKACARPSKPPPVLRRPIPLLNKCYSWAWRCRLEPMKQVAATVVVNF